MSTLKGHLLVPTAKNPDDGLWFIFHHEADGVLAFDLTREHPHVAFRHFEDISEGEPREKLILLGGPMQSDSALILLHNDRKAGQDSHAINDHFSFFSRKFVLVSGQQPTITNAADEPSKISISPIADYITILGFRLWNIDDLEKELAAWQWNFLPASPEIVFRTKRKDRLNRARLSIN